MKKRKGIFLAITLAAALLFVVGAFLESSAWARAGGSRSFGSRGSRSYSTPARPSTPSPSRPATPGPGVGAPGRGYPGSAPATGGWFSRSPFAQGLAGGLAGGFLGSMLFGGRGYAVPGGGYAPGYGGGYGGGGIGLMDIIILAAIGYFLWRFFKRRRMQAADNVYYSEVTSYSTPEPQPYYTNPPQETFPAYDELDAGLAQIAQYDPSFTEEGFKELAQDLFFRIQAGWMNRSLQGIENLLTPQMAQYFSEEFEAMKQKGTINRLENIAVRKVEPTEAWQEVGKDYLTILFTANLLDYTVDDKSGQLVAGDKLNPVKFEEFWTFTRDSGNRPWKLSAINQPGETVPSYN